jgi:hypothetical protein
VGTWLLTTALPDLVLKLAEWAGAFVAWVAPRIPDLLLNWGSSEVEVILWIGQKVADLVSKLAEWGGAFLGWVAKDVLPTLPEKLGAILTAITGWVGEKVGAVAESVKSIGSGCSRASRTASAARSAASGPGSRRASWTRSRPSSRTSWASSPRAGSCSTSA